LMSPKEAVSSHDITKRLTSSIGLFALGNKNKIINNESVSISGNISEEIISIKWEIERVN